MSVLNLQDALAASALPPAAARALKGPDTSRRRISQRAFVAALLFVKRSSSLEPDMERIRQFMTLLIGREELGEDPPAPPRRGIAESLASIVRIEALPKDPVSAPTAAPPFLKWLLWPETLPTATSRSTDPGG